MQGLITFREAQGNFFDRLAVQTALGRGTARALSKVGAFLRTDIRRSIKKARRMRLEEMSETMRAEYEGKPASERPFASSRPGEPPRGRTKRLRGSIYYAFDVQTNSAVIGPVHFPGSRSAHAPQTLEIGGRSYVKVLDKRKREKGRPATDAQAEGLRMAIATGKLEPSKRERPQVLEIPVHIQPRPYVSPSLRKHRARIPQGFREVMHVTRI